MCLELDGGLVSVNRHHEMLRVTLSLTLWGDGDELRHLFFSWYLCCLLPLALAPAAILVCS